MRRSQQGIGMVFVVGLLLLALAGSAYGGESASPATATAPPAAQGDAIPPPKVPLPPGLTPLFDGKSLDGWVQVPADSWTVKSGAMTSNGAGRGVIYTSRQFDGVHRIIFDVRHVSGKPDHQACVLVFCIAPLQGEKPLDALAGIQFQPPNGGHWDYRKGHTKPAGMNSLGCHTRSSTRTSGAGWSC